MNFRRWITALAVLALFAGFASAQVASSNASTGPFQCTASVSSPPVLRAEGLTELVGDMLLVCTGGTTPAIGSQLPTANITISFGTAVTSRLLAYNLSTPNAAIAANTSEALLLIDEPGSGDAGYPNANTIPAGVSPPGFGPLAAQTLCTVNNAGATVASAYGASVSGSAGGCIEYAQWLPAYGDFVMSQTATVGATTITPGANVFAGVVNSNQVTFFGIPMMPPASAGVARIFRMTNIRINANSLGVGPYAGTSQVVASVSISNGVPIYTPVQIAGFIQTGLTPSMRGPTGGSFTLPNLNQCNSISTVGGTNSAIGSLRFQENFGTAFKTRVSPTATTNGQSSFPVSPSQNVPGQIYNSESGFIFPALNGTGFAYNSVAGLADYGTRLKAVFSNVPTGVRIYVSTTNVVNLSGLSGSGGILTAPAGNSTVSFAQLVSSETQVDNNGSAPTIPFSSYVYSGTTPVTPYAEIIAVNGTATAVWEVINTNSAAAETFDFGVFTTYTASTSTNSPPPGTATVTMSYAPTPSSGVFTATTGAAASASLPLPRFADPTAAASNLFNIIQCTTSLLFPFVTNQAGFDTGLAIMNTSQDPFGTKLQAGTCALNFYGQNAPPVVTTSSIAAGSPDPTKYAFLASVIAPNFEGYMIAVCNFQFAHGYAFVSDLGAHNLAHGYLALIFAPTGPTPTARNTSTPEALEN